MDTPVNVRTETGAAVSRIVVVSADAHRGEELAQAVRSAGGAWNVVAVHGGPQQAVAALGHSDPDAMVLDAAHDAVASLAQLEHVSQIYPGMQIVLLSDDHSPEALRAAMRIGVREVLPRDDRHAEPARRRPQRARPAARRRAARRPRRGVRPVQGRRRRDLHRDERRVRAGGIRAARDPGRPRPAVGRRRAVHLGQEPDDDAGHARFADRARRLGVPVVQPRAGRIRTSASSPRRRMR